MNNLKNNLFGIDSTIQSIQIDLYNQLLSAWEGDIDGYGRVYKNINQRTNSFNVGNSYIPEWYNSLQKDYEDLYYNDNKSCVFCFIVGDRDTTEDSVLYTTDAKCVFMVDLSKIYSGSSERLDAKAHRDATEVLRNFGYNKFQINGIDKGIDSVFSDFDTSKVKFDDMHPLHCFSVNLNLEYYLTDKCL